MKKNCQCKYRFIHVAYQVANSGSTVVENFPHVGVEDSFGANFAKVSLEQPLEVALFLAVFKRVIIFR
jgi:hypothetical protein